MGRRIRKNNLKPLTDINGNQETLQVLASTNIREELQASRSPTSRTLTNADQSRINSSSTNEKQSCKNVKKMSKKQKKKERAPIEANKKSGTEMVLYDEIFAQKQKNLHLGLCCVCGTEQYSMKCCSRCGQLKYCSHECRRQHCNDFLQKHVCDRVKAFANARTRLKQEDKDMLLASGIFEISQYLYSVPRPEVYEMLNGPVKAVILKIREVNRDFFNLNIHVQDVSGLTTCLQIQCLFGVSKMGDQNIAINDYQNSLIPGEFILLVDAHWNYDTHPNAAAIVIDDLQHIQLIH